MNPETSHRDRVEALIRAYLRDQERTVDAARILASVRSKMSEIARGEARSSSRAVRATTRWAAVAAAAALMIGFAWIFRQGSVRADAIKLVLEAREALGTTPIDRAYRIQIDLAPGSAERAPYLAALATFDCRLWTRSDRFWIEGRRASQAWAFGRDAKRNVWVATLAASGLDFAPEEVPEPLDTALDLLSLDLDTILHLLATEFDVTALGKGSDNTAGVTRIRGTPRADHRRPRLRSITVEIDERTKTVRQVVLSRARDGRAVGEVSFTFDQAERFPDSAYQLSKHLDPDAPVFGPDRRLWRRRELVRFFGSLLLKGE